LLQGRWRPASGKTVIVRVNAMDTPHFADDIAAVAQPGVHLINIPKPESPAHVRAAVEAIERAEQANGVRTAIGLLLNIEAPSALRTAAQLARRIRAWPGCSWGSATCSSRWASHVESRLRSSRRCSRCASPRARRVSMPTTARSRTSAMPKAFRAEAMLSRNLGFLGKTCIHPSQIAIANEVFRPTDEEIAHACKVVEAARDADAKGVGAYVVDGKMIDIPFVIRARAIVASARSLGLLPG
jgi:citrate lyase subunit beta/citryl-CoA lyase